MLPPVVRGKVLSMEKKLKKQTSNNETPDYKTHDPKGWCGDPSRGAALGRPSYRGDPDFKYKFVLRKVPLDSGGYDPNGTYFGVGEPIYWYASTNHDGTDDEGNPVEVAEVDCIIRAADRAAAKQAILKDYPRARFFR